jgi:hypothetical protein
MIRLWRLLRKIAAKKLNTLALLVSLKITVLHVFWRAQTKRLNAFGTHANLATILNM